MNIIKSTKRSGFTLLEVLLGMSIMSLMMLLLFASLRICVQNWNAGEKKIAKINEAAIVQNFLQKKLQATLPLEADFFEEPEFSFQGDRESLQFVSAMPASASRLGLQLFNLGMKQVSGEEGKQLLVDIQPFFPEAETASWREEQIVILKKIKRLQFAYFGTEDIGEPDWQNTWLEMSKLPRLVRVEVELISGEVWPVLVIALKIDRVLGADSNGGNVSEQSTTGIVNGVFVNP